MSNSDKIKHKKTKEALLALKVLLSFQAILLSADIYLFYYSSQIFSHLFSHETP